MRRALLFLTVVVMTEPLVAQARGPRKELTTRRHCGRECPTDMHAERFLLDEPLCGASPDGHFNAVECNQNHGDGFVACGDTCGWGYAEDRDHPEKPRLQCGPAPKQTGPAVGCKAFGVAKTRD